LLEVSTFDPGGDFPAGVACWFDLTPGYEFKRVSTPRRGYQDTLITALDPFVVAVDNLGTRLSVRSRSWYSLLE